MSMASQSSWRVAVVLGTRPEAIKLAPVIRELSAQPDADLLVVSTGQHREMLDQILSSLGITADHDLRLMAPRQTLSSLTARALEAMTALLEQDKPDVVVVQGDTTTAFAAGLAAFYARIPVCHVEAGLRTGDPDNPFPEELNRALIGRLARWHCAPTDLAVANLEREGVGTSGILLTGNTVIDNLLWAVDRNAGTSHFITDRRRLLVTLHRRETQGEPMRLIAEALRGLADRGDTEIVLPLHKSPAVRESLVPTLGDHPAVRLIEPLDYLDFTRTLASCDLVLTDSGGVQEEAPTLGKPVLVLRETTERPEGVDAGTAILVGTDPGAISRAATELLDDAALYAAVGQRVNPYGDGRAAQRIVGLLRTHFVAGSGIESAA